MLSGQYFTSRSHRPAGENHGDPAPLTGEKTCSLSPKLANKTMYVHATVFVQR